MSKRNILIVTDGPTRSWLEKTLSEELFEVHSAEDWFRGTLELLKLSRTDLIICDLTLDDKNSLHFLRFLRSLTQAPVIMLTAGEEPGRIVRAMNYGAHDCLEKPIERDDLLESIESAFYINGLSPSIAKHEPTNSNLLAVAKLVIGKSGRMREIQAEIASLVHHRTNILLQGESGTGKRLISKVIHETGVTSGHRFVAVDLPTIPEQQLERVLFGEVKWGPTGRTNESRGMFELATAGTLFLNGICEILPRFQEKLLSVLLNKSFEPVGGNEPVPVRARLISTSRKDLGELVRKGEFSQELIYRIADSYIIVPPLRERTEDIPELVTHFLRKINRELGKHVKHVPAESMQMLKTREWLGNVRELEITLLRAVAKADGNVLKEEYLTRCFEERINGLHYHGELTSALAERDHVKLILDSTNWDKKKAARLLNFSRQTLYNKIRLYKITPS